MVDHSQPSTGLSTRGRILASIAAIERHETPAVIASFLLFFCIMAGFFAVRPVRDTVGTMIGEDSTSPTSGLPPRLPRLAIVLIYGWIVARFRRSVFLPWTYAGDRGVVGRSSASCCAAMSRDHGWPVFLDLHQRAQSCSSISVFWSFLLELFRSGQAKRLFGFIAAGGTAGALAGPLFTDSAVYSDRQQRHPVSRCRRCSRSPSSCQKALLTSVEVRIRPAVDDRRPPCTGPGHRRQHVGRRAARAEITVRPWHHALRHPDLRGEHVPVFRAASSGQPDAFQTRQRARDSSRVSTGSCRA